MRRGNAHDSVQTIIAAANAMSSAEGRVQQGSITRRRWKSWFGMYFCFGSHNHANRINQSVLVPEPLSEGSSAPTHVNSNQSSIHVTAPPPSPSSFLQSEPPSITQSPTKFFSLSALAANSYSPTESSVFTVGPYANDTRLVSPPIFSTFTTEPSTAPFTPPEPMQQMSPSSPEVPFARLLSPSFTNKGYDLHPGSPICHLISPRSVCSGTSSPFPDMELCPSPDGRITAIPEPAVKKNRIQHDDFVVDEDAAFEFTAQEVARRMKNHSKLLLDSSMNMDNETAQRRSEEIKHSSELGESEDFKFNFENENMHDKNWAFFPLTQSGSS